MAADLFVSYARSDWDQVRAWVERLEAAGVSVWIDRSGIDGAHLWTQEIAAAIESCRAVVLMASTRSMASANVIREVTLALENSKPILPLLLEPVQIPLSLRLPLAGIQRILLYEGSPEEQLAAVRRSLRRLGLDAGASDSPATTPVIPGETVTAAGSPAEPGGHAAAPQAPSLPLGAVKRPAQRRWMALQSRWERRRWSCLAGIMGVLAASLLWLIGALEPGELQTVDLRFHLRGPRETHARIMIAEIADATERAWPEPMVSWGAQYRAAVRRAQALGATWIGLDLILKASGGPRSDDALKQALASGRVILANSRSGSEPSSPLDEFVFAHREQPINIGFVNGLTETDGIVRRAAVFAAGPSGPVPSFAAVLALRARGRSPTDATALRELARSPGGQDGAIWINYVGAPRSEGQAGAFPFLRLEQLATDDLMESERRSLQGAIVLIGVTSRDSKDRARGPGNEEYSGVEIHAHTLATLLDGRPLRRASPGQEALMVVGLGGLTALALAFLGFGGGIAWLALVLGGWCWLSLRAFSSDLLLPVVGPAMAMGLAWGATHGARVAQEFHRLRRAAAVSYEK